MSFGMVSLPVSLISNFLFLFHLYGIFFDVQHIVFQVLISTSYLLDVVIFSVEIQTHCWEAYYHL